MSAMGVRLPRMPPRSLTTSSRIAGGLTAYKYPREVQIAADLPKRQNGKILKRELRPE